MQLLQGLHNPLTAQASCLPNRSSSTSLGSNSRPQCTPRYQLLLLLLLLNMMMMTSGLLMSSGGPSSTFEVCLTSRRLCQASFIPGVSMLVHKPHTTSYRCCLGHACLLCRLLLQQ